jgi:hypothetical protein
MVFLHIGIAMFAMFAMFATNMMEVTLTVNCREYTANNNG